MSCGVLATYLEGQRARCRCLSPPFRATLRTALFPATHTRSSCQREPYCRRQLAGGEGLGHSLSVYSWGAPLCMHGPKQQDEEARPRTVSQRIGARIGIQKAEIGSEAGVHPNWCSLLDELSPSVRTEFFVMAQRMGEAHERLPEAPAVVLWKWLRCTQNLDSCVAVGPTDHRGKKKSAWCWVLGRT